MVELVWYGKPEWTVSQSDGLQMSETSNLVHALEAAVMGWSSTDVIPDPDPAQFIGSIVGHHHGQRHMDIVTIETVIWTPSPWRPSHGHCHSGTGTMDTIIVPSHEYVT